MKLDFLTTAAITTITLLLPLGLTDSAKAQECDEMLSVQDVVLVCENDEQNSAYHDDINKIYQEVLGREADSQGLITWLRELSRSTTLEDIRNRIAKSKEAKRVVNRLYQEVLGRNVDPSGLKTYTSHLARGWSQSDVREHIQRSDEARKKNPLFSVSLEPTMVGEIIYYECQALNRDRGW
jgi:hypothetical protein